MAQKIGRKRKRENSSDFENSDVISEEENTVLTNDEKCALKRLRMTIHMIKTLSVKDFNDFVRGKSKEDSRVAKTLRRKLKNRGYAADCRNKREERIEHLQNKKETLEKKVSDEIQRYAHLLKLRDELQEKCCLMESLLESGCPLVSTPTGQIIPELF